MYKVELVSIAEPNPLPLNWSDRRLDNAAIAQLLSDTAASIRELRRKNEELQKTNDELRAALQQANEKSARSEQPERTDPQLAKQALQMAAQLLLGAEQAAQADIGAARALSADGYEEMVGRALELQRESIKLLEKAREEALQHRLEADRKALERMAQARAAILSMAEDLGEVLPESSVARLRYPGKPTTHEAGGSLPREHPEAAPRPSVVPSRETASRVAGGLRAIPIQEEEAEAGDLAFVTRPEPNGPAPTGQPAPTRPPDLAAAIELTASPFNSLAALVDFWRAVRRLPGVTDVTARAFDKDRLQLTVHYSNPLPLIERLMDLPQYQLQPVSVAPNRIEVHLAPAES